MSLLTNWGYTIDSASSLTDMLTLAEFDDFTASKWSEDDRIPGNIAAACSAIRNYCGWHVYPSLTCTLDTSFFDRRVALNGGSVLIQLPARFVSSVTSIKIGGTAYTSYVLEANGLLKVYNVDFYGIYEYTSIEVVYVAGVPSEFMDGLKELVAHRVTHAMASSGGVQSETAGGVSITYSANWTNSARATALADDNKEVLQPFKLTGVF